MKYVEFKVEDYETCERIQGGVREVLKATLYDYLLIQFMWASPQREENSFQGVEATSHVQVIFEDEFLEEHVYGRIGAAVSTKGDNNLQDGSFTLPVPKGCRVKIDTLGDVFDPKPTKCSSYDCVRIQRWHWRLD
jgi:hypothetical protein